MIDGKTITLGGQTYTLAPTPFVRMVALQSRLATLSSGMSEEGAQALIDGLWHGLRRNHPELERQFVEDNLDATNMTVISNAFAEVNQLGQSGEGAPGESAAG